MSYLLSAYSEVTQLYTDMPSFYVVSHCGLSQDVDIPCTMQWDLVVHPDARPQLGNNISEVSQSQRTSTVRFQCLKTKDKTAEERV